jgi:hypothetical protein
MSRAPRRMVAAGVASAIAVAALVGGGCSSDPTQGYSFTHSHDETVRTVAVPMFQNPTFTRGIEVELTDAIIKEIQSKTPWRVTTEGTANTTLSGTLTDSRLRSLSIGRGTGYSQELAVELSVDFDWKDARTGKTLVSRRSFTASEAFVPASPANERIEAGQHAAIQRMARDIVAELRSNW